MIFDGLPDIFIGAFGQSVTVMPRYGMSYEINAIFRQASETDLVEPGIITSEPYLSARTADVSELTRDDLIQVGDVTYRAAHPTPEDKGMSRIMLRAV